MDKSQGTSFINLTYFKFACGDENPLKLVKSLKYYEDGCRFLESATVTLYVNNSLVYAIFETCADGVHCRTTLYKIKWHSFIINFFLLEIA